MAGGVTSGAQSVATGVSPFDQLAANYDEEFSHSLLGGLMRRTVWRRLERLFTPGQRLLELGCGTGEDTLYLARRGISVLATDASQAMVEAARRKLQQADLAEWAEVRALDIEDLGELNGVFDGVVSSFGPLNCVADLSAVAAGLAPRIRPGGKLLLGIMGPWVPWEWLWFFAHGEPGKAFRRLRPGGSRWRGSRIRYPSVSAARRAFRPYFRPLGVRAVGALLPPTYADAWARRHPRLVYGLARWERRLERLTPLVWLADHYLLELERSDD